jgi:hypothetical protein
MVFSMESDPRLNKESLFVAREIRELELGVHEKGISTTEYENGACSG